MFLAPGQSSSDALLRDRPNRRTQDSGFASSAAEPGTEVWRMSGFFPRWTLKTTGEVAPDERLSWPQTAAMGLQHVVAMFGSTALAPLLMGFDPNTSIFFSGVGTLIFFLATGGRLPSYLGSSFAFIAVVIAATGYAGAGPNPNLPVALGGIVAAGVVYALIGLAVQLSGTAWVERLMPPVVTGAIVAAIGLNLAPVAVKNLSAGAFDTAIGLLTVLAVAEHYAVWGCDCTRALWERFFPAAQGRLLPGWQQGTPPRGDVVGLIRAAGARVRRQQRRARDAAF